MAEKRCDDVAVEVVQAAGSPENAQVEAWEFGGCVDGSVSWVSVSCFCCF